ncbi:MAG: AmmeMemoRadiSam system protein B [Spartobacteria bacterium]|nr:AmmeMemoRadiSam system protein B [Spartobacteria bacterium]
MLNGMGQYLETRVMRQVKRHSIVATVTMLCSACLLFSCGNNGRQETMKTPSDNQQPKKVLYASLAGTWYTPDGKALRKELEGYLKAVPNEPEYTNVCALVLPHAGYRFSGPTAARALKEVRDHAYKRVIVMGPSHRMALPNMGALPGHTHFSTPVGETPLDIEFMERLRNTPFFEEIPQAFNGENSVEIQIPFAQVALQDFLLVPIVIGQLDRQATLKMAELLAGMIGPETLVIASGDFTHFGRRFGYVPFTNNIKENIRELDMGAFDFMKNKDAEGFAGYVDETGATICGRCPFALLLDMLPDNAEVHLTHYETSGDITGDYDNPVSYVSAAITGAWEGQDTEPVTKETSEAISSDLLTMEDKTNLLRLARGTLTHYLKTRRTPTPTALDIDVTPGMKEIMGAFVTLHKNGQLRGCIGEIFPRRALYEAVIEHAVNSGVNDTRFPPVNASELPELDFEISALSRPERVSSFNDIVIGKHGVVLHKGGRQAVFLPQVAPEQGWGLEETLTHLSMKAGLPPDAWREGASFDVFEAIVFGEHDR